VARRAGDDADVIVAGAGPAGAAFAARLARAGHDVLMVDRARFPRDKVCGDFVGPLALVELEAIGVDRAPGYARANAAREAALHIDGEHLITQVLPRAEGAPPDGRVIPRVVLDAWIVDAARRAGARLLEEHTVAGYDVVDDGVVVATRRRGGEPRDGDEREGGAGTERRLRARLVIGADGSASAVARALHGAAHPRRDMLVAVRAYYDRVAGPSNQCDLYFSSDSFPGYCWLFPTGNGSANVGVGMVAETVPPAAEHLRDLLQDLMRRDAALRARLRFARARGKIVGWPLATYNPKIPLTGDRVMLIGDAAGLINPINGEGIQYALCSARWAAETALAALREDDLSAARLRAYARRVVREAGVDMALSRLVVHAIANRTLNGTWLGVFRALIGRARRDRRYADVAGGILAGLAPSHAILTPRMLAASFHTTGSLAARHLMTAPVGTVRAVGGAARRATAAMLDNGPATLRWARLLTADGLELAEVAARASFFASQTSARPVSCEPVRDDG
jgi:menaquinone-9 beta-reductase